MRDGVLGQPLGRSETHRFSEGNLFVRVGENVRGRDTYLVQGTAFPANDNFMELLFWIDALKRASAASVTAVIPYFGYAKGDKKDQPRVSIRARVCADAIQASGVDRVVTMDLHAPQVQGFFKVPVDDPYALPVLCEAIREKDLGPLVVVSPNTGFAKKARLWANRLGAPLAIADKRRPDHSEAAEVTELIGAVEGQTPPAYQVSKAALNALTRTLAAELSDSNVLVNAVCPGWVATDMGGRGGRPVRDGAAGVVWAATLPDDGPTGGFFRDGRPVAW